MIGKFGEAEQESGATLAFNEAALQPAGQVEKKSKIAKRMRVSTRGEDRGLLNAEST
jgi:hypothetical protein